MNIHCPDKEMFKKITKTNELDIYGHLDLWTMQYCSKHVFLIKKVHLKRTVVISLLKLPNKVNLPSKGQIIAFSSV